MSCLQPWVYLLARYKVVYITDLLLPVDSIELWACGSEHIPTALGYSIQRDEIPFYLLLAAAKEWQSSGTGCPEGLWSLFLWRYSKPAWMWSCSACSRWPCFSRGLDYMTHRGPFQPLLFCNSVKSLLSASWLARRDGENPVPWWELQEELAF